MPLIIPQAAIDLFVEGKHPLDVFKAKIKNRNGAPVALRTAEHWHQAWRLGQAATSEPLPEEDKTSIEETDGELTITTTSERIKTLDGLLAAVKPDLKIWEVKEWTANSYEGFRKHVVKNLKFKAGQISGEVKDDGGMALVTMWSVKARFVRRQERPFEEVLDRMLDRLRESAPRPAVVVSKPKGSYLFLPCIVDVHIGKRGIKKALAPCDAAEEFIRVAQVLIARIKETGCKIEQVVFPAGNDALHIDNRASTTTAGTPQPTTGSYQDIVDAACYAHIETVKLLAEIAPVHVVVVEGNHDRNSAYWLGKTIQAYFSRYSTVTVDLSRDCETRKYYPYGSNLLGFTHGDGIKADLLGPLMSIESPHWSNTRYHVFFRGNWHKKESMFYPIVGEKGVIVETLPALCPTDEWHAMKGFVGTYRSAEARLFHKKHGPAGVWPVFADELG